MVRADGTDGRARRWVSTVAFPGSVHKESQSLDPHAVAPSRERNSR